MSDRVRKELEEKRSKLAELRRAREERRALLAQGEKAQAEVGSPFSLQSDKLNSQPVNTSRRDVNDLVDSLLGAPPSPAPPRHTPNAPTHVSGRSTPPDSTKGTPVGRTSRLSNVESLKGIRYAVNSGAMEDRR